MRRSATGRLDFNPCDALCHERRRDEEFKIAITIANLAVVRWVVMEEVRIGDAVRGFDFAVAFLKDEFRVINCFAFTCVSCACFVSAI